MFEDEQSLVSVVLAVRNCEKYVCASIDSLLEQTYQPLEIIVIDDGSSDATPQRLSEYGKSIVLHSTAPQGVWSARNLGIDLAQAQIIAFQDADDIAPPERIKLQTEQLLGKTPCDIVFGQMIEFSGEARSFDSLLKSKCFRARVPANCPGAMLARRSVFTSVGPFSEELTVAGFMDWYMRALEKKVSIHTPGEIVLGRRRHAENSTLLEKEQLPSEYLSTIRRALKRRKTKNND